MQKDTIQRLTVVAAMLLASTMLLQAGVFDGTKWKVKVVPDKAAADKGAKEFDDEFVFADGTFASTALLRKGFKPSKYRADIEPTEAEFEIEQRSETNGVVVWEGEIRGTNTLGGLQWMQEGRADFLYEFSGSKE